MKGGAYIEYRPVSEVVKAVAVDLGEDYEKLKGKLMSIAVRCYDTINRKVVKDGRRKALLTINQHTNTALLPCDFKVETFVGIIDEQCGTMYPLEIKAELIYDGEIEDIGCSSGCVDCTSCYPKSMCNDISSTLTKQMVDVNGEQVEERTYTTLLPSGEIYEEKEVPYWDTLEEQVGYKTFKRYVSALEMDKCGCIKKTDENESVIKSCFYDCWCMYCNVCKDGPFDIGGYKIFPETGVIKFDSLVDIEKVYIEYRSSIPKQGNEYLIPDVAFDLLVEKVKEHYQRNKANVSIGQKRLNRESVSIEMEDYAKVTLRTTTSSLLNILNKTPKFDEHSGCYYNYFCT